MADGVTVDVRGLRNLSRDILRTAEEMAVAVPSELGVSAKELADTARQIAASYESTGETHTGAAQAVADSVRARPVSKSEWLIEAGGSDVPLAGLWELGNTNSAADAATFRHPTYGKPPWQNQRKWRFLTMAMHRYEPVAFSKFRRLVDAIFRRNRL